MINGDGSITCLSASSCCRDRSVRSSAASSLFSRAACHADSLRCLSLASSPPALMRQNTNQNRYQDKMVGIAFAFIARRWRLLLANLVRNV